MTTNTLKVTVNPFAINPGEKLFVTADKTATVTESPRRRFDQNRRVVAVIVPTEVGEFEFAPLQSCSIEVEATEPVEKEIG